MIKDHDRIKPTPGVLAMFGPQGTSATEDPDTAQAARTLEVGNRVRSARLRAGIKAAELASMLGLERDKLSKIEHGKRRITPIELPRLATALGVSTKYLLEGAQTGIPALAFRLATPEAEVSVARQRAGAILDVEARLQRSGALEPATTTPEAAGVLAAAAAIAPRPPRTKNEAQRQGRELANEARRLLDLGIGEIGDLAGLIEQHFAADVALSPLGEDVSGLCAHAPHQALLLANTECSTGHVRFTLGHELAHHLLQDPREVIEESVGDLYSGSYTERRASSFAAYLLLPERGVLKTLAWLDVTDNDLQEATPAGRRALGYVMAKYGVSMPCALYQLADLGLLTFDRVESLKNKLRAGSVLRAASRLLPSGASIADRTKETRVPTRLLDSAWSATREGKIGLNTLARLLERQDDDELFEEVFSDNTDEAGADSDSGDLL
jgi:transcriptional regulator with XRE-family HTH domain/Zn-dependent peptidase ImmA (M78 family)